MNLLAEQDPTNAIWQRDLAVACLKLARLESKAEHHALALSLYEEAAGIYAALAETAPGFAAWAKDKAQVESELARCRLLVQKAGEKPDEKSSKKQETPPPSAEA